MENKEGPLLRVMVIVIFGKGVPAGSPNTNPIYRPNNVFFSHPFSDRGS